MKNIFIFLGCLLISRSLSGQIVAGIKLNPGFGIIRSAAMNSLFSEVKKADNKIVNLNAGTGAGFNVGLGGFVQYNITPIIAVMVEPSFNLLYSRTYLNYKKEELDKEGSGNQTRIASTAKLRVFYFNLPILARYTFLERKKIYVLGGVSLNLITKPHLNSEEMRVDAHFKYNNLTDREVYNSKVVATLDQFSMTQVNVVLGVGKTFRRSLKNLSVDIRYNFPLTSSAMFNTTSNELAGTYNNRVFSSASSFSSPYPNSEFVKPGNFRMSVINVAIKYTLYKK